MQNPGQIGLMVPDSAPNEDKIICDLINKGFSARQLLKASSSFYRHELEQKLRIQKHIKVLGGLFLECFAAPQLFHQFCSQNIRQRMNVRLKI